MKKIFFLFLFTAIISQTNTAQNFTWVKGTNTSGVAGVYGTIGVASALNNPGGRHGCGTWVDASGNLWLFGGEGYTSGNTVTWLSDLWKYNIATNQWTWVKGPNIGNVQGTYGTMGVAAPGNEPGAREFMSTWIDALGNFWLFGGDGYGSNATQGRLGDLWKYNPTTNQWTWVNGFNIVTQNGIYGTLGVTTPGSMPGSRYGSASWTDSNGNLLLFGGRGYPATGGQGHLNDLWRYNIVANSWTWIHGTDQSFQNGVYGTKGVSSPSNMPGGRYHPAYTKDNTGKIYLIQGLGLPASPTGPGYLNDIWRYDEATNAWAWLGGSNLNNQAGQHGTLTVSSATTVPGGRYSPAGWADASGKIWVFGGHGMDSTTLTGDLNDLWKFDPITAQWTWMKGAAGNNKNGIYGTQGVAAPQNMPGARQYNTWWTDNTGRFWLFAGEGRDATKTTADHMNDLWGYSVPCNPDSVTASPNKILCTGNSATLTAFNTYSGSVSWYSSPTATSTSGTGNIYTSPPLVAVSSQSIYTYYASTNNCTIFPRTMVSVTVSPLPQIVITGTNGICAGQTLSLTASGANSYTWNTNAMTSSMTTIPTGPTYTALVIGTNTAGCEDSQTHTVSVFSLPSPTIATTKTLVCRDQVVILSVTGVGSYTWSTNVSTPTVVLTASNVASTKTIALTMVDNNGCARTVSTSITFQQCISGLSEEKQGVNYSVYPNPSQGKITIDTHTGHGGVMQIFNQLGENLGEYELIHDRNEISTQLAHGIYYYKITEGSTTVTGKLVIE